MLHIYNLGMRIGRRALLAIARMSRSDVPSKFVRFARGQKKVLSEMDKGMEKIDRSRPTVWINAASLGEFGISSPIIRLLKQRF